MVEYVRPPMNIALWILQVLLALHTVTGALWKLSNPAAKVESLAALPQAVWLTLSVLEVLAAIALLLPALGKRFSKLAPLGAAFVVAEMLLFCVVHLASGVGAPGELAYWLVVAALAGFVAWGRFRAVERTSAR